jgi:hypothetical protein
MSHERPWVGPMISESKHADPKVIELGLSEP